MAVLEAHANQVAPAVSALSRHRPTAGGRRIRVAQSRVTCHAMNIACLSIPDIEIGNERSITNWRETPEKDAPITEKARRLERRPAAGLQRGQCPFRRRVDRFRGYILRVTCNENRVAPAAARIGFG